MALRERKFTCAVFYDFGGNLGSQNFVAYRDFKKAIKLYKFMFIVVQAKRKDNILTDRLCLISTFKLLFQCCFTVSIFCL